MSDPQVKVAVLEQRIENLNHVIVRLDDAIEKLSEVNSNVTKMLAVHEERITKQEETDLVLFAKIDKLRDKVDGDYDGLLSRIQGIEKRIWMALGAIACITFVVNNFKIFQTLTPPQQSSIMEHRNFKA